MPYGHTHLLPLIRSCCGLGFALDFLALCEPASLLARLSTPILDANDITVDSRQDPQVLTIRLRRSKTDPLGNGTHIHVGRNGAAICPVSATLAYLAIRPPTPGPLFIFQNGTPLSRGRLVSHLHEALSQVGINVNNYSGHSFRIGAATAAAKAGFSDSFIQTLGRWRSSAFTTYIRTPATALAAASAALANTIDPPVPE